MIGTVAQDFYKYLGNIWSEAIPHEDLEKYFKDMPCASTDMEKSLQERLVQELQRRGHKW